jgi:4-hydroxy-3-polyprenylbenzoate decarboxylase
MTSARPPIIVAMTGASGTIYAVRLLEVLLAGDFRVHLSLSPAAASVALQELGLPLNLDRFSAESLVPDRKNPKGAANFEQILKLLPRPIVGKNGELATLHYDRLEYFNYRDFNAPMASGSALNAGMVICPCSGGTLSAVAHAASGNLIHRAADVQLKEGRKLILVPREAPMSLIQIDNLKRAARAGAVILPASPGFYHGVEHVVDLVDFVVARICDQLGVEHHLMHRWGGDEPVEA